MRSTIALALISIGVLASVDAFAQEDVPAPEARHADRPYFHDGFYLRMALGGGGLRSRDQTVGASTNGSADVNAGGGAVEVSVGGTPGRGLVLAGSFIAQGGEFGRIDDGNGSTKMSKAIGYAIFGGTLDLYPHPQKGMHFMGTIGPAFMSVMEDDRTHRTWKNSAGAAVSFAVGYDWWVGPQWSLGFLARMTGARFWGTSTYDDATKDTSYDASSRRSLASFSMLFAGTFH